MLLLLGLVAMPSVAGARKPWPRDYQMKSVIGPAIRRLSQQLPADPAERRTFRRMLWRAVGVTPSGHDDRPFDSGFAIWDLIIRPRGEVQVSAHVDVAGNRSLWLNGPVEPFYGATHITVGVHGQGGYYVNRNGGNLVLPENNAARLKAGKVTTADLRAFGRTTPVIDLGRNAIYAYQKGSFTIYTRTGSDEWKRTPTIALGEQTYYPYAASPGETRCPYSLQRVSDDGRYALFAGDDRSPADEYYGTSFAVRQLIYDLKTGKPIANASGTDRVVVNYAPPGHPSHDSTSVGGHRRMTLSVNASIDAAARQQIERFWNNGQ